MLGVCSCVFEALIRPVFVMFQLCRQVRCGLIVAVQRLIPEEFSPRTSPNGRQGVSATLNT